MSTQFEIPSPENYYKFQREKRHLGCRRSCGGQLGTFSFPKLDEDLIREEGKWIGQLGAGKKSSSQSAAGFTTESV